MSRLAKQIETAKRKSKYRTPTPLWRDIEVLISALAAERFRADDATVLLISETKRLSQSVTDERQRGEQAEQDRDSESLLLATVNAYIRDAAVEVFGSKYRSTGDDAAASPDCVKRFLADLVQTLLSALAALKELQDERAKDKD